MTEQAPAPAPVPGPAHALDVEASALPGFFSRAEHAIEQMLPGHGAASAAAPVELHPSPEAVTAALHGHAAAVFDLVRTILELEASHGGQAGLDGLAVKALRVAGGVVSIAGLAG